MFFEIKMSNNKVHVVDATPIVIYIANYYASIDSQDDFEDFFSTIKKLYDQYTNDPMEVLDFAKNNIDFAQLKPLIVKTIEIEEQEEPEIVEWVILND